MNQTLSLPRFQKVLRLHFAEYRKSYLLSLGLCIGGMVLLMSPILLTQQYNDALYIVHISALFGILFGSSLFTSTAFNAYSNASQGITAIMLPASQAEKFLVILLTNLLFVLLIGLVFLGLHFGLVDLANEQLLPSSRPYRPIPSEVLRFSLFTYFLLQGCCFMGSIFFKKNAFIMTLGVATAVVVLAFGFNLFLAYQFTGDAEQVMAFPFTFWNVVLDRRYTIEYPDTINTLIRGFLLLMVVATWGIAYVKLKEKEI
uniref:Uncharacterized protein n=1 Tax=Roseihalotalea indica TaxID=2867963 RepID=A0AA49GNV8_9BACT|nr:hypothetical protein K4G66_27060 [Tunicatimonas sp. TK19036]